MAGCHLFQGDSSVGRVGEVATFPALIQKRICSVCLVMSLPPPKSRKDLEDSGFTPSPSPLAVSVCDCHRTSYRFAIEHLHDFGITEALCSALGRIST